jgi:hypothetical protein
MNIRNFRAEHLKVSAGTGRPKPSGYLAALAAAISLVVVAGGRQPSALTGVQASGQEPAPAPQQPSEVAVVISGDPGTPPRYAVPDFVSTTAEAADVAKSLSRFSSTS